MKSLSDALKDWREARERMQNLTKRLPVLMGAVCVNVVKQNFILQGYDSGSGIETWPARTDATNKSYTYGRKKGRKKGGKSNYKGSVYQPTNKLLLQTRNLYNAIKHVESGQNVFIGVDLGLIPYAQKMNEGGPGHWGKNATNTPPRKYLPTNGPNPKMLKAILKKVDFERNKALNYFHL